MKLYFKAESVREGRAGVGYVEFTDGEPTRQAEVYGDRWIWADKTHNVEHGLLDQPLDALGPYWAEAIEAEEFERAWEEARGCATP